MLIHRLKIYIIMLPPPKINSNHTSTAMCMNPKLTLTSHFTSCLLYCVSIHLLLGSISYMYVFIHLFIQVYYMFYCTPRLYNPLIAYNVFILHTAILCIIPYCRQNVCLLHCHLLWMCNVYISTRFDESIKQESWNYVYSASGTQPAFTRFQAVIDHHLNNNFKMQTIAMNYKNRHPWMTEELRTQIKHKNALYAETLKKRDKDIQEKYKKLKNELTSSLKNNSIL